MIQRTIITYQAVVEISEDLKSRNAARQKNIIVSAFSRRRNLLPPFSPPSRRFILATISVRSIFAEKSNGDLSGMSNKIIIAGRSIGLFGLEAALLKIKQLIKEENIHKDQAAERLLELVEKKNYIPSSSRKDYILAFDKLLEGRQEAAPAKPIRILGPGCVGCDKLEQLVLEVLAEQGIAADIYHVTDRDEIWRYGVTRTPALLVGDEVLSAGTIPTSAQIQAWLSERL